MFEKSFTLFFRGEKSRIAAKCRRDKENIAMLELIDELPVPNDVLSKMDKAAVIKLAISFIKIKHFVQKGKSQLVLTLCVMDTVWIMAELIWVLMGSL